VVADFYGRVLGDPLLASFFRGVHMSRMQNLQVEFFAHVLGGEPYFGRDLVSAHRGMNIQDAHFNAVAGHLTASLEGAGVPAELVGKILAIVGSVREQITQPEAARKVG
jgi:hemoglobin